MRGEKLEIYNRISIISNSNNNKLGQQLHIPEQFCQAKAWCCCPR